MDLPSHIKVCVAMKKERLLSNQMIRIIWHIAKEHGTTEPNIEAYEKGTHTTLEDFIKAISPATTTNPVEPIKEK